MDSPHGFRFACVPGCSRCCDVEGYVYLTENDLLRAAAHVGLSPADFEQRYVYRTRYLIRLRKPKGKTALQCHFRDDRGCSISCGQACPMPALSFLAGDGGKCQALAQDGAVVPGYRNGTADPNWNSSRNIF